MKKLLMIPLLALPAAAAAQGLSSAELTEPAPAAAPAEPGAAETLKRPDAPAMMAELSAALRLSSKQEERISEAINKKTKEFDRLMKDYEKNSAEEKKWRARTNESRYGLQKINRDMPDLVREFLDDEQRQTFDRLLESRRKPAPAAPAVAPAPAGQAPAKPVKKRKLVRRKKVKGAPGAAPARKAAPGAPAAAQPPAGDNAQPEAPAEAEPPSAQEPAEEEADAGSYP